MRAIHLEAESSMMTDSGNTLQMGRSGDSNAPSADEKTYNSTTFKGIWAE